MIFLVPSQSTITVEIRSLSRPGTLDVLSLPLDDRELETMTVADLRLRVAEVCGKSSWFGHLAAKVGITTFAEGMLLRLSSNTDVELGFGEDDRRLATLLDPEWTAARPPARPAAASPGLGINEELPLPCPCPTLPCRCPTPLEGPGSLVLQGPQWQAILEALNKIVDAGGSTSTAAQQAPRTLRVMIVALSKGLWNRALGAQVFKEDPPRPSRKRPLLGNSNHGGCSHAGGDDAEMEKTDDIDPVSRDEELARQLQSEWSSASSASSGEFRADTGSGQAPHKKQKKSA